MNAAKSKGDARRARQAREAARSARFSSARWAADGTPADCVTTHLIPFLSFNRPGKLPAVISFTAPGHPDWSESLLDFFMNLTRGNMQTHYERAEGWGWKEGRKRGELASPDTRYLVARGVPGSDGSPGPLLGFLAWRFLPEGEADVLYVWEMQLAPEARRQGLGKHLMQMAELVARKQGMQWVFLTVFKSNPDAVNFYTSLRYTEDDTSPGEGAPHTIMSKCINPAAWDAVMKEVHG